MVKKPKILKEIHNRDRNSKRRQIEEITNDILSGYKDKQLYNKIKIFIEELIETCEHNGASNPYC
jgi:hypothetical protein